MSAALEIALLAVIVAAAASWVALPLLRPPAQADEQPAHDESRGRLFAALEELGRDRKAGMISPADYAAAVSEIRRRLSQL